MKMLFVKVADSENEESVEIPVEPQGYILMSTLTAQFPGACGLKFKTEQFSWRGVRVVDDKIYPPGDDKWDSCVYIVTYPKDSKRKGDDLDINSAKSRKIERKCVDLIVLGIPWKSTEEVVRRYFEQYGEVVLCEIKRDASNNSKGFGFVRFKDYNNQCSVLGKKHFIDGRWCDVKIPNSQEPETSRKIFVGRLSENLTSKDLQDYFAQYGQVIDVYIPKPFRAFGFVTFVEADVAQSLCGESHIIKGVSVHVSRADPKEEENHHHSSHHPHAHHGHPASSSSNGSSSNSHSHHSHRNDSYRSRFSSNGHSNSSSSSHQMTSSSSSGATGSISSQSSMISGSKSMGQLRNKINKYDHSGNSDLYESRRNDTRSPNMPPHHHHHHGGSSGTSGSGGIGNGSSSGLNGNVNGHHDQMNAMMSMFNPMMAAFLQQLAGGIQPNGAPVLDGAHSGPAGPVQPPLGHHHGPAPWTPNDYPRNGVSSSSSNSAPGLASSVGGYSQSYANGSQHSRFKGEKNF